MRKICEPVELKNLSVKNRLVRSATWEGIANPDGSITDESYEFFLLEKYGPAILYPCQNFLS